jgi:hypothetical protein
MHENERGQPPPGELSDATSVEWTSKTGDFDIVCVHGGMMLAIGLAVR